MIHTVFDRCSPLVPEKLWTKQWLDT